ncbi:MAG: tripartite tricarboxylate transporter substrate-binding protein [Rhodospirillaceae bacterium]
MINARKCLAAAAFAAAAALTAAPAQSADPYFKDKTITFVVGFGAGGGYDAYARMLAPLYEKELGASVVVVNQPGAGGMTALNRLYSVPSEGLQMTIVNGTGAGLQQLLDMQGVKFDLTKFPILGIVDHSRWIWLVKNDSPFKSPMDAMKSSNVINWAGYGKISGISDGAAMTCHALELKCNVVTGYKGSRQAALAIAQGEMDALYVSETSAFQYVQAQNARAIATVNRERSILFPDVPTIFESTQGLSSEQEWWLDYRATLEGLGRILVMPPSTPDEAIERMRAATHRILSDEQVVAEAERAKRYIKYIPAEKASGMIDTVLKSVNDEQKKKIHEVVLGN